MSPLVEVKSLHRYHQSGSMQIKAVDDISCQIFEGEILSIVGSSGSGKSTFLSLLAGLDHPSSGEIWIKGQALHQMSEEEKTLFRRNNLGFIFQSFQLFPQYTALENVLFVLELQDKQRLTEAREDAIQLLSKLGLGARLDHRPEQLSGGEQQRVAIARAFAAKPKLLLADEPTGNLDQDTGEQITASLLELQRLYGTTIIIVTHDITLAQKADRILQMKRGKLSVWNEQ